VGYAEQPLVALERDPEQRRPDGDVEQDEADPDPAASPERARPARQPAPVCLTTRPDRKRSRRLDDATG